ncbi:MAG: leucine-rich repeat protein [Bacteroidales bacterium]|nr:leucine-rich repeat protein [Bacteroidales bacterium]
MKIQNFGKPLSRLIIMVAICMLSLHAMAYDFSYTHQGTTLCYNITSDNTVEVTYYSSDNYFQNDNYVSGDVVIPSSVTNNGTTYSVASIGEMAFYHCSGLTSVTIGNSVTSIADHAFEGCSGLTSVTIGNSVTSIGADAFYKCSGLTSVTIPNSVTSISGGVFFGCSSLTSVTIPNSVTSIGNYAFGGCSGLTSVTLPNNATIYSKAFMGAGTKPTIDSVIYCNDTLIVGNYTFICTGFLTFYLNGNSYFPSNNAVVLDCDESKSGDLIIPSTISYNGTTYSVTSIGECAFVWCSGLTSVTIPNSVTSIGESAFSWCSSLTSVTIPNSVTSIADYAFAWCSSLTSIVSNAVVPPALGNEVFPYPNSCNVTVPCGSLEAYTSSQWNNYFPNRIEEDCSSALQEVESTREFVVYPNPARGFAIVEFEALQEHSLLRIADLGGRIVKTFDLAAGTESVRLDLRDLPSGVYTLMIGSTTKKLIVE